MRTPPACLKALRNAALAGRGVYEMATEYAGDRTFEQQIVIQAGPRFFAVFL